MPRENLNSAGWLLRFRALSENETHGPADPSLGKPHVGPQALQPYNALRSRWLRGSRRPALLLELPAAVLPAAATGPAPAASHRHRSAHRRSAHARAKTWGHKQMSGGIFTGDSGHPPL